MDPFTLFTMSSNLKSLMNVKFVSFFLNSMLAQHIVIFSASVRTLPYYAVASNNDFLYLIWCHINSIR